MLPSNMRGMMTGQDFGDQLRITSTFDTTKFQVEREEFVRSLGRPLNGVIIFDWLSSKGVVFYVYALRVSYEAFFYNKLHNWLNIYAESHCCIVALSVCVSVCPLPMILILRPLIDPEIMWSVSGLRLVTPLPSPRPDSPHPRLIPLQKQMLYPK